MTVKSEFTALSPTATAKAALANRGNDIASFQSVVNTKIDELKQALALLIAMHPNSGGDSANYTALNAILSELN